MWIVGAGTILLSLVAIAEYRPWEEWVSVAIGAWFVASPWVFGFTAATAMAWGIGIAGAVLVVLGVWALLSNAKGPRYA